MGAILLALMALEAPLPTDRSDDLRGLMAHTETAAIGLVFRDGMRGRIGGRIPMMREGDNGFGMYLTAMVELHNELTSDQILPNENWRAYVELEFTWRKSWQAGVVRQMDVALSLEHESDHWTGREDGGIGQLNINNVRTRVSLLMPVGDSAFVLATAARTYIASCSQEPRCGDFSGNMAWGGSIDLLWDLYAGIPDFHGWSFFTSLHLAGIVPAGKMSGEARAVLHVGGRHTSSIGQWQVFGIFWAGNTVGIDRAHQTINGGGGFRYTF